MLLPAGSAGGGRGVPGRSAAPGAAAGPVSYTHLDVYKRQEQTAAEDACKAEHILSEQTLEKIRESALRNDAAHPQAK